MKIVANTLIKNEQRWIWYALKSVIDQVDEIKVWDTGSSDQTVKLVQSINSPKIKFKQISFTDPQAHTKARQQMLDETDADWVMILDGDEIWWQDSLKESIDIIKDNSNISALVSQFINCVGDIFHYQEPSRSRYQIAGVRGPYNIRFINRQIPGLHVSKPHGGQEYRDNNETPIQNFPQSQLQFVHKPYLHTTHLLRSVSLDNDKKTLKRDFKYRFETGRPFASDFVYPEVFYLPKPNLVPDPFIRRNLEYELKSLSYEPFRIFKNLANLKHKSGY